MWKELPYLLQVQVCVAVLWSLYRLISHSETCYRLNRFFLLGIIAVSFLLPALSIPLLSPDLSEITQNSEITRNNVSITSTVANAKDFDVVSVAYIVLLAGSIVMLTVYLSGFLKLRRMLRSAKMVDRCGRARIYHLKSGVGTFSFFNSIYIDSSQISEDEVPQVLAHEMCHVRLGHTYDLIVMAILKTAFWWNPFIWFWEHSLVEVHEYQADNSALKQGFEAKTYLNLILKGLSGNHPEFVSGFSYSLIKKRLIMISKPKQVHLFRWKLLFIAPAIITLMTLFSTTTRANTPATSEVVVADAYEATESDLNEEAVDTEYTQPNEETLPSFPGGNQALSEYLSKNLKYPQELVDQKIQGSVRVNFTVEQDGKLKNVKVANKVHPTLDEIAVELVKGMPDWTPGTYKGKPVSVNYQLPVIFKIPE